MSSGPRSAPGAERFAAEIDSLRSELRIPGLAAAVVREGKVAWAQGFGYADVAWKTPVTPHTPFHLASLTKPVAAVTLMRLVDKGAVGLDDPLANWGIRLGGPGTARVWNLLSHSSSPTPEGLFRYDGGRYALLERIIGRATGRSFEQELAASVLAPLGMAETAPNVRPSWESFLMALGIGEGRRERARVYAELARPYRLTATHAVSRGAYSLEMSPSAGLISTVLDLAKLDAALDGGSLMRPATRELMWRPMVGTSAADGSLWYGLGWFVQYAYGMRLVWHYGIWPPSVSALWLKIPEERLSLILLANTDGLSAPFPLGEGDVLCSAFALAFARSFVYPRRTGRELPAVNWKALEADLVGQLLQVGDPIARDLLERELWSRRQLFATAGRWDLAGRLLRVRGAAFPESRRAEDRRFTATYGGFEPSPPLTIGVWGIVWGGRIAAVWLLLTATSVALLLVGLPHRFRARLATRLGWLPSVVVFGAVALAAHLVAERRGKPEAHSGPPGFARALAEAFDGASWHALILVAAVAAILGSAAPRQVWLPAVAACCAAPPLAALLRPLGRAGTGGGGYSRELRASGPAHFLVGAGAAAPASAAFVFLMRWWFDGQLDSSSPLYWLAAPAASAVGALLILPAAWWLLRRRAARDLRAAGPGCRGRSA